MITFNINFIQTLNYQNEWTRHATVYIFSNQTIALDPAANVNLTPRVHVRSAPTDAASHKTRRHAILSEYV